jgi:hypothetical protein
MSAQSDPRREVAAAVDQKYYYRRSLTVRELLPAIGAAVAAAAATFYLTTLFIERTPLMPGKSAPARLRRERLLATRSGRPTAARNLGRR